MITFEEKEDCFESTILSNKGEVVISIDKPTDKKVLDEACGILEASMELLLNSSIDFINNSKSAYNLMHIDDLSDPQIMFDESSISVYWYSEKGEATGQCIIGVDYNKTDLQPFDLTVGD